ADEVRDRRDALLLGDPHELAQKRRPRQRDERGSQVDRQELEAPVRGEPDGAVEGPRRAVDRDRHDVREGPEPRDQEPPAEPLGDGGDDEEEAEVREEDGDGHGPSSPPDRRAAHASTATIAAQTPNRYSTGAGTPATRTARFGMERSGQTRSAPNSTKHAARSSLPFTGYR